MTSIPAGWRCAPAPLPPIERPPHQTPPGQGGVRAQLAELAALLEQLEQKLGDRAETRRPGGGAANPGAASTDPGQPLRRLFASDYADGRSEPAGADRPSARAISNAVSDASADKPNKAGLSDFFWAWGQFIDHDLDLTKGGDETFNIAVPKGDPVFDPDADGDETLDFTRSAGAEGTLGRRQQINEITALMDASMVYGSTAEQTQALRSFENGRLRMTDDGALPSDARGFFIAGDSRVNENPALTALHTLFVREHNRIADAIAHQHPHLGDQEIFEAARRDVTAQIQAITINEFLPALFGERGVEQFMGGYRGYTGVDAQVSNAFATAAFRFGHSMVSDSLAFVDADGDRTDRPLAEIFFSPRVVAEGGIDPVLRGLEAQNAQALDTEIVDSLRNLLLPGPDSPRLDLAALNIQRGRDHGMPSYNDARAALGLAPIASFHDPAWADGAGARLAAVYDSPDDVDLWVGLLSEAPQGDGLVGHTQSLILADQFNRTRDGDPNWFERTHRGQALWDLYDLRLADIIARNTEVTPGDRDVFRT